MTCDVFVYVCRRPDIEVRTGKADLLNIEIGQALLARYEVLEQKFRKEVERYEHQVGRLRTYTALLLTHP